MPDAGGLVQKNTANVTQGKHIHNYSTFDRSLSYRLYNTLRFGDYTPSFVMEGVPTDEIQLNSLDRIDSLSLNAPFKGSIRKIKETFAVPNMALLPMNWDKIYAQPSNGDDVPDDANCVIKDFPARFKQLWLNAYNLIANVSGDYSTGVFVTAVLRTLILGEFVYSHGCLLNVCGYKGSAQFRFISSDATKILSYDEYFDSCIFALFSKIDSFVLHVPVGSSEKIYNCLGLSGNLSDYHFNIPFRRALEIMRENPLSYLDTISFTSTDPDIIYDVFLKNFLDEFMFVPTISTGPMFVLPSTDVDASDVTDMSQTNLNLSRLLAYQIICAHYYTNSSLDVIYSADIYRQYIHTLYEDAGYVNLNGNSPYNNFSWNGYDIPYDYLSGHCLRYLLLQRVENVLNFNGSLNVLGHAMDDSVRVWLTCFAAWSAIFGFRKSLRYGDYFVGSRPRPLAPVNTDVAVNNNMVSVVDVTRNIQAQRFANAVMRSRQKIEEYVKSLFGKAPAPDYHNPFFLARSEEMIFGDEVQNTAETQATAANSRTSNFASNISPYTFTFHNDDSHPCIYIQIISFDIRRAYTRSVERPFLHLDRFDMFNPDFQYIGDQPVYGIELGYPTGNSFPKVFAYQSRDMEYKERFDQACSGFVENLPGWILTDGFRSFGGDANINPDFIRSYNTELDQFYLSLTGYSLGSYFHFTCITDNNVNARRPMAVDPQILA